jgi:hypothetical protein
VLVELVLAAEEDEVEDATVDEDDALTLVWLVLYAELDFEELTVLDLLALLLRLTGAVG